MEKIQFNEVGFRFLDKDYEKLITHLFQDDNEQLAYLFCKEAKYINSLVLIVNEIIIPTVDDIEGNSNVHVEHKLEYFRGLRDTAIAQNMTFFTVHSHHNIDPNHSPLDDQCDLNLLIGLVKTNDLSHGSLIFSSKSSFCARILNSDLTFKPIDYILKYGTVFEKLYSFEHTQDVLGEDQEYFDRQIRMMTSKRQSMFAKLNIAVIGVGGTGSSVSEQLRRLGIGNLLLIDMDEIEKSNISRLYCTKYSDDKKSKTEIISENLQDIYSFGVVEGISKNVFSLEVAHKLKMMDFIFVCTDENDLGRYLTQLIVKYYGVPAIDVGLSIITDNNEGLLAEVIVRTHYLTPKSTCLFSVNTLDWTKIYNDLLQVSDPRTYNRQVNEGYITGVKKDEDFAVISFNTTAAAYSIGIFMRLVASKYSSAYTKRRVFSTSVLPIYKIQEECECDFCKTTPILEGDQQDMLGVFSWD